MNAYLIQDDDYYVVSADSMQQAISYAEDVFVVENYPDLDEETAPERMAEVREDFRSMLQSCTLVGPVK